MTNQFQKLLSPALRAKMGDWIYYITLMRMEDISDRVQFAEEIHPDKALSKLIQRQLEESHSQKIAEYLLGQPQRFFNSIVLGIYKGDPQWLELDIRSTNNNLLEESFADPDLISGMIGLLLLSGDEKIFAIDGQHRVAGIKRAIISKSALRDEKVSVIFVAHRDTSDGVARTRRLFTSLNRYAKPVSPLAKIALDEDDVVAIVTRKLMEEYPLFKDRILDAAGVPLSSSNKKSFTTVLALYKTLDLFLAPSPGRGWAQYKKNRPDDSVLDDYYLKAENFWKLMVDKFKDLKEYINDSSENPAERYRHKNGGHILFRPLGIMIYAQAINQLIHNLNLTADEAIDRIAKVPFQLSEYPWTGLVWNSQNKTMITNSDAKKAASQLLFYSCGGDLSTFRPKSDINKLKKDIAALQNITPDDIKIHKYV